MNEKFRLGDVHRKIEKVTHVDSIEYRDDGTWGVLWSEGTTQEQKDQILAILNAVDVNEPTAPRYVKKVKFMKAVRDRGRLNAFQGMINSLGATSDLRFDWDFDDVIDAEGPLIAHMKAQLNLTDEELEEIFLGAL